MPKSVMERMLKTTTLDETSVLEKSKYFKDQEVIDNEIPGLNIAMSGDVDIGYTSGVTIIAGPSKHYKSGISLEFIKPYLEKHKDAICVFYDSEFGTLPSYFETSGIDTNRVLHCPVTNIEELKFDLMKKLEELTDKDNVIFFVDSLGNLASIKELEDAKGEKTVEDMTRAKKMKGLFRMITPLLTVKGFPFFGISHTYDTIENYSTQVVSGGKGQYYSAGTVLIMGRRQLKEKVNGKDKIVGYEFMLTIDKSRHVREKTVIPIRVTYDGGICKYSGLLDIALAGNFVSRPSSKTYTRPTVEDDKKWFKKQTHCAEFWDPILADEEFKQWVRECYQLGASNQTDLIYDEETGEIIAAQKIDD